MAFWALTRFGEAPSSDVLERFERRLPYVMARLKPKELANVASAYGRVGGGGGVLPKLAERCAFETGLLSRFAPHEFATLLWGLAKAECAPLISMKVLERFRVFLSRNVVRFDDPRDVSLALWALATLHPKPTRAALDALRARRVERVRERVARPKTVRRKSRVCDRVKRTRERTL